MKTIRISVALALLAPVACSAFDEETGGRKDTIWNGSPSTRAGVVNTHMLSKPGGSIIRSGSGIALNNRWVLSAKHVRQRAGITQANPSLITADLTGISYQADQYAVISPFPLDEGDRKFDLDVYSFQTPHPLQINGSQTGFLTSIFSGTTDDIILGGDLFCHGWGTGGPAGSAGVLRSALLTPRTGSITAVILGDSPTPRTFEPPVNFFTSPNAFDQQIAEGDSGGPCFNLDDRLVGVARGVTGAGPSPDGVFTSVAAFTNLHKQLRDIAVRNPSRVAFFDVEFDTNPDLFMVVPKDDGFGNFFVNVEMRLGNSFLLPLTDGVLDFDTFNLLGIRIPASEIETAVAAAGDFNGNGAQDALAFVGNELFYFDGLPSALPIQHLDLSQECLFNPLSCLPTFTPIESSYARLIGGDFNSDGFADVDGLDHLGFIDTYYGSPHGLTRGFTMFGMPSSDGKDGRFLTVTAGLLASIGVPSYLFRIHTSHEPFEAPEELHIDVFDGDVSGSHDTTSFDSEIIYTCYQLYADPDQDGSGEQTEPLLVHNDTHFTNDEWASVLDVPADLGPTLEFPEAQVPGFTNDIGSRYSYLLRVFVSRNPCSETPEPPLTSFANALKIRANGSVSFMSSEDPIDGIAGAMSVEGSDALGDFSAIDNCTPETCDDIQLQDVDTTYDGTWTWWVDTTLSDEADAPTLSEVWFAEADADSTLNTRSPGVAFGASDTINFQVAESNDAGDILATLYAPDFPSGNFDPTIEPCVAHNVVAEAPATDLPATIAWHWSGAFTRNNFWLANPATEPSICLPPVAAALARIGAGPAVQALPSGTLVPILPLRGEPLRFRIRETTASPLTFWTSQDGAREMRPLLPLFLGDEPSCKRRPVGSVDQALAILQQNPPPGHAQSQDELVAELQAQALAAKLNLERGRRRGEQIGRAFVYATTERVSEIMTRTDQAFDRLADDHAHCGGPVPTAEELQSLTTLLRAINAGSLTYWLPTAVSMP